MTTAASAYIGLGSNLGRPRHQLERARAALTALPHSSLLGCSTWYRSRPVGPPDQPDYLNGAALLDTKLPALELLRALQAIEQRQGRVRDGRRWEARTLDLDLLLYGDLCLHDPVLTLPHPQLRYRAFVLYPLHELAPELEIPGLGSVRGLLPAVSGRELLRVEPPGGSPE